MDESLSISRPLKYLFTTAIFAGFGFILLKYHEDFYIIRNISIFQFLSASLLTLLVVALNGSKLNRISGSFNIRLRTGEWFALSSMTTVLNSVFFKAGSLAISTYLKKVYKFPYSSFAGTFLGDQFIILFTAALFESIASLYLGLSNNTKIFPIFAGFTLISAILFFLMRGQIRLPKSKSTVFNLLTSGIESFNILLRNKDLLYSLCTHNLFLITALGLRFLVACSILQLEIPLSNCFLFAAVMIFARVIPISHSDIGVRELAIGFLSGILGSGLKAGVLATVVDRIFELFWSTLCAGVFRNSLVTPKS